MLDVLSSFLGLIVLIVGIFYVAKSTGQQECNDPKPGTLGSNQVGGWVGFAFGLLILCIGAGLKIRNLMNSYTRIY